MPGQVRSILAFVPVGADGSIWLYNRFGDIHATVDLMGYLIEGEPEATRKGRIVPLVSPFRALDTRSPDFFAQPLPPANAEDWSFEAFVDDVTIGGDPVGPQVGLIGNIAGANLARVVPWAPVSSYLTAYPTGASRPTTANLVIDDGEIVPNMVMLGYGGSASEPYRVRVYNRDGFLDYVLDVSAVVLDDL